jgi:hypothetical protein
MSAQKAIAGVRRLGKEAYQFKFTSEFEYIALECKGTWRPTLLKVMWFRNHRKVESIPVKWITSEDRGPNGASGKAKFKPTFSVGLVVTLYKEKGRDRFEEKEYKYYVQDRSGSRSTRFAEVVQRHWEVVPITPGSSLSPSSGWTWSTAVE